METTILSSCELCASKPLQACKLIWSSYLVKQSSVAFAAGIVCFIAWYLAAYREAAAIAGSRQEDPW